jgi:type II secretory pathway component GspD/PulD (secretin)
LQYQFRNQPWPDVLQWLAKVSDLALDWQELPSDYINLSTRRPYTLAEAKDDINSALLKRGFTMLEHEGSLTVSKIENMDLSFVPRVRPEQLDSLQPHSFVKTTFELSWLLADEVGEELQTRIGKYGQLTALLTTNSIEAMDIAKNLAEIQEILIREQSAVALENLAQEFHLAFARASDVKEDLEAWLNLKSGSGGPMMPPTNDPRAMQQFQQQIQQQQQQAAQLAAQQAAAQQAANNAAQGAAKVAKQRSAGSTPAGARSEKVYIIVHAPPRQRALIEAFISRVDVPNEMATDYERINIRTKVFRLLTLSPKELVDSLQAMDALEPTTRLQINEENRSVVAYASLADQLLIQQVIDRLDAPNRTLHVLQLRRLDAESVAGSVRFLLMGDEEEKSNNRGGFYDPWGFNANPNNKQKKAEQMRVTANIRDNQILLMVNDIELEEVKKLLVKLGEVPQEGGRANTVRVVDASRSADTYQYLQQLQKQFERSTGKKLQIPDESEFQNNKTQPEAESPAKPKTGMPEGNQVSDNLRSHKGRSKSRLVTTIVNPFPADDQEDDDAGERGQQSEAPAKRNRRLPPALADLAAEAEQSADFQPDAPENNQTADAPISIRVDERGNLILESDDTQALDQLEQWMYSNRPPKSDYEVFTVQHAPATWVRLNLKEYFEKQETKSTDNDDRNWWFYGGPRSSDNKSQDGRQLGKRAPLEFIADNDTNTIVVKNADDRDLRTIADLIKLWDVPQKPLPDSRKRYSKIIPLKHSRSELIIETIKDVYRDYLSSNDKAFEKSSEGEEKKETSGFDFPSRGVLSLAADKVSNRIIVSTQGRELLEVVVASIQELDQAANDQGYIEVVAIGDGLNVESVHDAIRSIMNKSKDDAQPAQPNTQAQPQANGQQPAQPPANSSNTKGRTSKSRSSSR